MKREVRPQINPVQDESQTRTSLVSRSLAWLFSPRHFHLKLLSGTALGLIVIVSVAGASLFTTMQDYNEGILRTRTIKVMRLSSAIENDIAALETGHRGFLLTGKQLYLDPFNRRREVLNSRIDELMNLVKESSARRKGIMKVQEIVQKWLDTIALKEVNITETKRGAAKRSYTTGILLGAAGLDQAREILQSFQDEERIDLDNRRREQESVAQSAQILDFMPKLERSVV
ncbi:MAG: CHASE3 domain-containing protein, partial [Verrucomicrobiota bacterium]